MGILTDCWQLAARYLGTRVNRLRLTGCRIQVILSVKIKSETNFKLLVVKSGFSNTWGLPQEGVNIGEDFVDAVKRCLSVECGVEINGKNNTQFERAFNIRKISYVSTLELPKDRHDERNISDEDSNILRVSTREAYEESGLSKIKIVFNGIFDIDVHIIPERGCEMKHYHNSYLFLKNN